MSLSKRLEDFLKKKKIKFQKIVHAETFTSQQTAQAEHMSGRQVAKVVIVKADGKDVMAVLPASHKLDLVKLKSVLKAKELRLEEEQEFIKIFPDCEKGAMPPFGALYDVPLYIDKSFTENKSISFNAGNHKESVKMTYEDYEKLAKPKIADIKGDSK